MPATTALVDLEDVRPDVDAAVRAHLDRLAAQVGDVGPETAPLLEEARALLTGGKRMRAAFCYWGYRAHGGAAEGPARDAAVRTGAALELFQAAALFHDDVMDHSDTRRGRPTAHRAFGALHADAGWAGSSEQFGTSAAILLGDLCLIASQSEVAAALRAVPAPVRRATREVFDHMQSEVIVGQYLDVLVQAQPWGQDPAADEERARRVLRAKSARYSVEHPLALGASLAGAEPGAVAALRAAGLPLGEAFQLRDDVLGVFGDPAVTGKPAGDDLREGKRTVLMARTLAAADAAQRELVLARLGDPDLDAAAVDALREAIVATGALDAVERLIDELADEAFAALDAAGLAEPGASVLVDLARATVHRSA